MEMWILFLGCLNQFGGMEHGARSLGQGAWGGGKRKHFPAP